MVVMQVSLVAPVWLVLPVAFVGYIWERFYREDNRISCKSPFLGRSYRHIPFAGRLAEQVVLWVVGSDDVGQAAECA
jgi:hypothetical protein